jgi:hypothetical protein
MVRWSLSLPDALERRVTRQLYNPVARKARYGARSDLVVDLLTKWVEERERTVPPLDLKEPDARSAGAAQ